VVTLVGLLDSPYVRRVAIALQLLGIPFEHQPLSVFRDVDAFRRINPVVKAPTFVCEDGTVLMDSTLILEHAERLARPRSLMPADFNACQHDLRVIGLALAACEKSVQIVYERELRPADRQHAPWVDRVRGQLLAAFAELEGEMAARPIRVSSGTIGNAGVTVAVTWAFARHLIADVVPENAYPALAALSVAAEALPEFIAAPHGVGRVLSRSG
jgi:Glutathione S-transferase